MLSIRKQLSFRITASLVVMQFSFVLPGVAFAGVNTPEIVPDPQNVSGYDMGGPWYTVALAHAESGWEIESYKLDRNIVAWTMVSDTRRLLYVYDGVKTQVIADMDLGVWNGDSENEFFDHVTGNYDVADGHVVWVASDGLDREVYAYHGERVHQISDNTYDDVHPVTSKGRIAWTSYPSAAYNLMMSDGYGVFKIDGYHVMNYAFSGGKLYWINRFPGEDWFRVFVNSGLNIVAIGQGDDWPRFPYFLSDGKGTVAWEYSTKQWSYDKRRLYVSYDGAQAYELLQRDVPPMVTYIEDVDGYKVLLSVHDLLTTRIDDYQFQIVDPVGLTTIDHEVTATKARFIDGGFVRHLVAENGSAITSNSYAGAEDYISLKNVVYEVFDADGPVAAGALLDKNVITRVNGDIVEIPTEKEVRDITVTNGDIAWLEGEGSDTTLKFATRMVLVKTATGVELVSGKLVKTEGSTSVYLAATDGKRYAFPDEGQFYSWYDGFDSLRTLRSDLLAAMPLGGNVLYSDTTLVKTPSSPEVYTVDSDGVLHWVKSASVLVAMVGEDWESHLNDIPESMLVDYSIGQPIGDIGNWHLASVAML